MNTRAIEEMGNFTINGIIDSKVNLGIIKAFKFCDTQNSQNCIYVISNHTTLPSLDKESILNVRLYKKIAILASELLIFEEGEDR